MRIGLDIRYAIDYFPGIGRYTFNLARALNQLDHSHTLVYFYSPTLPNSRFTIDALQHPNAVLAPTSAHPFTAAEQYLIPLLARHWQLDLLHSPYYIKPYVGLPCPSVVTIYDLIARFQPQTITPLRRWLFLRLMWLAVRRSQRIITLSQSARTDLVHCYPGIQDRVVVTPPATDEHFRPRSVDEITPVRTRYNLPQRYVLSLASNKPHKNQERLIEAWARLAQEQSPAKAPLPRLVVAGRHDPRYREAQDLIETLHLQPYVTLLPNVAEADLPTLYSGAELFVFPSYYEGFGLPPLEAMACGTPVLCSHASSLPEVVGDAAILFDPFDVDELTHQLRRLISAEQLRAELRQASLARAQQFSWAATAQQTLAIYMDVIERGAA